MEHTAHVNRRDKLLVGWMFYEHARVVQERTTHDGFLRDIRFLFAYRGLTLRKYQEIKRLVADWSSTVTANKAAHADAGSILFSTMGDWDGFFDGTADEMGGTKHGIAVVVHCPGISFSCAETLHQLFDSMFDQGFYLGFDIQLPQAKNGAGIGEYAC
jgi:hypothetical protein